MHAYDPAKDKNAKKGVAIPPRGEPQKPEGLPAKLADTVIRIMDLCDALNIDLEKEILRKMEYNLSRSHKHGGKAI